VLSLTVGPYCFGVVCVSCILFNVEWRRCIVEWRRCMFEPADQYCPGFLVLFLFVYYVLFVFSCGVDVECCRRLNIYIYIYIYIYTFIYPYTYVYIHTYIHIYIYMYLYIQYICILGPYC